MMLKKTTPKRPSPWVLLSALSLLVVAAGCAQEDTEQSDAPCGGHGEIHDDHCHCDTGFTPSSDGLTCLEGDDNNANNDHSNNDHSNNDHANNDHSNNDHSNNDHSNNDEAPGVFSPTEVSAAVGTSEEGDGIWLLQAQSDREVLRVELYASFGALSEPGSVEMSAAEADYATCGTCLILQSDCSVHDDHLHCARTFMPRPEGSFYLDAVGTEEGDSLAGGLRQIVFQEVTIAEDYTTEVVEGGQVRRVDMWSFNASLVALGGAEAECGGHGHLHGDQCHCDTGYAVDPEDPTVCVPQ
jgi:hypothetical protein